MSDNRTGEERRLDEVNDTIGYVGSQLAELSERLPDCVAALERIAVAAERIVDVLEASHGRPFPETTPTAAAPNVFLCFHCGKASALPPDLTRGFACANCGAAYPAGLGRAP